MLNQSKCRKSNSTIFWIIMDAIPESHPGIKARGTWGGGAKTSKNEALLFFSLVLWVILQLTGHCFFICNRVGLDQWSYGRSSFSKLLKKIKEKSRIDSFTKLGTILHSSKHTHTCMHARSIILQCICCHMPVSSPTYCVVYMHECAFVLVYVWVY